MVDMVDWRLTSKCPEHCMYCYAFSGLDDLVFDDKLEVVSKLAQSGCESLCITGGEPMLNSEECIRIIDSARSFGMKIYLSTTGYGYLDSIDNIEGKIVRLSLPLDGASPEANSCNGRSNKSFSIVTDILDYYSHNSGPYIKLNTTVTSRNDSLHGLLDLYNLILDYHIDLWEIYEFIPEGRGLVNQAQLSIPPSRFLNLREEFTGRIEKPVFPIEFSPRKERDSRYFIIQPNGDVIVPIDRNAFVEEITVGNILHQNFTEIEGVWRSTAISDTAFQNKRVLQSRQESR